MIDPQSIVHDISSEPLDNNIIISNRLNRDIFIRWLRGIRLKLLWDVKAHPLVVNSCLYYNYSYTVLTNYFFTERKMTWYNIQVPWGAMWIVDLFWKIPFIYCLYLSFMSNLSNANNSTKWRGSPQSPTCTSCILVVTGTVMSIFWLSAFSPEMYLNSLQNILLWSSSARDLVQSCQLTFAKFLQCLGKAPIRAIS